MRSYKVFDMFMVRIAGTVEADNADEALQVAKAKHPRRVGLMVEPIYSHEEQVQRDQEIANRAWNYNHRYQHN